MADRAAVVGASGYTGAELLRLLAGHHEIEVVHVTADSNAGVRVADLYPSLSAAYGDLRFCALDPADLDGLDLAFVALPHGQSQRHAAALASRVAHLVDIGADFRLPAPVYEQWYGEVHQAPALLGAFAYGLPELFRSEVTARAHVANPGCYPTAAILALAPLVAGGLVEPTGLVVDAVSGVSGRGRGLSAPSLFSEANENVAAYGLLTHRHTAEMEEGLSAVSSGGPVQVLFTPHLVPMTRGILATCYARPAAAGLTTEGLLDRYRDFYAGEPFVAVLDQPPSTKATLSGNAVHLTVRADPRTGTVLAIAAEDNLVKGASGQALQNANLLLGLSETTGLSPLGLLP
ncbi:MAG: N-acetyl-gamma-glutamyl-phosphate reductase [Acidimicrobiia bacterium]